MRCAIFTFCLILTAAAARAEGLGRSFQLQDQFGAVQRVEFPRSRAVVLAFADRRGSDQLEGWLVPLYERYGDSVDIHGVAELQGVPAIMRPLIRSLFRRKANFPVMLDWDGSVCGHYGYEADLANILVLCGDGHVRYRFNGKATPDELERCFEHISGLKNTAGHEGQPVQDR